MLGYYSFDWPLLLVLATFILGMIAQSRVQGTYKKYSQTYAHSGMTGAQAAQTLLRDAGIDDVQVLEIQGTLTDHYDPRNKVLRLSSETYHSPSLSALGVAAHEVGHAIQHSQAYAPLAIRNAIVPIVNVTSKLSMPLFIVGLLLGFGSLALVGVALYAFAVLFQLITLPVEFNASSRAIDNLEISGILTREESPYAKKVLNAAACTYLASALMAIAQLLRLAGIAGRRRR